MSEYTFSDWFRCPICGDDGEVSVALVFGHSGDVKFKCESREHRLSRRWYKRYVRKDQRSGDEPSGLRSLIGKLFPHPYPDLMSGGLRACVSCPECGSSNTDGAVEHFIIDHKYERRACICGTVWCNDCESVERRYLLHDSVGVDEEDVVSESEYPPSYI